MKSATITENARKYAAEPSGARKISRRLTPRASGKASQQALAEEQALQKGLAEKFVEYRRAGAGGIDSPEASPKGADAGKQPNQFVEKGAEVYAKA